MPLASGMIESRLLYLLVEIALTILQGGFIILHTGENKNHNAIFRTCSFRCLHVPIPPLNLMH